MNKSHCKIESIFIDTAFCDSAKRILFWCSYWSECALQLVVFSNQIYYQTQKQFVEHSYIIFTGWDEGMTFDKERKYWSRIWLIEGSVRLRSTAHLTSLSDSWCGSRSRIYNHRKSWSARFLLFSFAWLSYYFSRLV